jgi:hypothetical protein
MDGTERHPRRQTALDGTGGWSPSPRPETMSNCAPVRSGREKGRDRIPMPNSARLRVSVAAGPQRICHFGCYRTSTARLYGLFAGARPPRSSPGRARRRWPAGCARAPAASGSRWTSLWPVLPGPPTRWTSLWPVLAGDGPNDPARGSRCPPPSSTRSPSPGERPSPPGSAAATTPDAQVPVPARVSLCPRRLPCRRETMSPSTCQRPGHRRRWPVFRRPSMAGFGCPPRRAGSLLNWIRENG